MRHLNFPLPANCRPLPAPPRLWLQFLVTADDSGLVKLFNYPVVVEDAPHRAYRGHSSHVLGVRFNANDTTVCSVGGRDWAIFQFRLVHLDPTAPAPAPPKPVWGALDPQGEWALGRSGRFVSMGRRDGLKSHQGRKGSLVASK